MREYPVPFSAREETPFMAGLTVREMLWIGGGFMLGLVTSAVIFSFMSAKPQNMILSLPVIFPWVLFCYYLAKKKVKEDDKKETLDRHYFKLVKYRRRPHIYLNYRREGDGQG